MSVAYPSSGAVAAARLRPPSGSTAESLVLAGLVLQVIGGVFMGALIAWLFGFSILFPYPFAWAVVTGAVLGGAAVAVFLYFVYTTSYQRIQRQEYAEAQTPTLILGILSLFAGIVPGVLYLIAYAKLGDAVREQSGYWPGQLPGAAFATSTAPTCRSCGRLLPAAGYAFCPNCGQRLAMP